MSAKLKTKVRRDLMCAQEEIRCVDFYRSNLLRSPDGSFMRAIFRKGYEAAMRDLACKVSK